MSAQALATVTEAPRRSLLVEMATRYGMEPKAFADTLKATVVPKETSNEEFAAFLVVAREYNLNPLTKEIYAFPKRGGGIQPIVPIDGWTNIINANPALDGIEFDDNLDKDGNLASITCRIWRKDRSKPILVTEYMAECKRPTDTWKQYPRRMLRHKALIQCARYAFGLAGIVDPDEAARMVAEAPTAPKPPAPPMLVAPPQVQDDVPEADTDPETFLKWVDETLASVTDNLENLETVWNDQIAPRVESMFPPDREDAVAIFQKHEARFS